MKNLEHEELQITIKKNEGVITVKWLGNSRSLDTINTLNSYLDSLLEVIEKEKLVIDFRSLKSMNSSTIIPVLMFFKKLNKKGIETKVLYDTTSDWQMASFIPLQTMIKSYHYISFESGN